MKGHKVNIERATKKNNLFRQVLYTAKNMQLVLMSLKPGEDIGEEVHKNDQFFRFEEGKGKVLIDGNEHEVSDGDSVIVPAGARHNVINQSKTDHLKMYTIYAPPHHKDQTIHKTKEEAEKSEEEFDGVTTEHVVMSK